MEAHMGRELRMKRWQDGGNLLLGIWLLISPWIFGRPYMVQSIASAFWLLGAIIAVNSALAVYRGSFRESEWINLIAGIVMSLFALNQQILLPLMVNALLAGLVIFILALWALMDLRRA